MFPCMLSIPLMNWISEVNYIRSSKCLVSNREYFLELDESYSDGDNVIIIIVIGFLV